jgi:hypothetical protein
MNETQYAAFVQTFSAQVGLLDQLFQNSSDTFRGLEVENIRVAEGGDLNISWSIRITLEEQQRVFADLPSDNTCQFARETFWVSNTYRECEENESPVVDSACGCPRIEPGCLLYGSTDLLFHPVYQCPAPYVRCHDSHGSWLSPHAVQALLLLLQTSTAARHPSASALASALTSTVQGQWGSCGREAYAPVEHPRDGRPCVTVHVCDLPLRLKIMNSALSPSLSPSAGCPLHLLQCIALLGGAVGLRLSSAAYAAAEAKLTAAHAVGATVAEN